MPRKNKDFLVLEEVTTFSVDRNVEAWRIIVSVEDFNKDGNYTDITDMINVWHVKREAIL